MTSWDPLRCSLTFFFFSHLNKKWAGIFRTLGLNPARLLYYGWFCSSFYFCGALCWTLKFQLLEFNVKHNICRSLLFCMVTNFPPCLALRGQVKHAASGPTLWLFMVEHHRNWGLGNMSSIITGDSEIAFRSLAWGCWWKPVMFLFLPFSLASRQTDTGNWSAELENQRPLRVSVCPKCNFVIRCPSLSSGASRA